MCLLPRRSHLVCVLAIVAGVFGTISCNRVSASHIEISPDAAMAAVQAYGTGANNSPLRPSQGKPDETDEIYGSHIATLLAQENFAELEKMAAANRVERGRLIGGTWKQYELYETSSKSAGKQESDYLAVQQTLNKWRKAYPQSATPRIAMAQFYIGYAWLARGDGFANSVSEKQWKVFNERIMQAEGELMDAAALKDRDANWYSVMLEIAQAQSWTKPQARELFDQAVKFEPLYVHNYRYYSYYLKPQWNGEPGDIKALAEEMYARFPQPDGAMMYFEVASADACYCSPAQENLAAMSYPKLVQGWSALRDRYGVSNLKANRFAMMALTFQDQPSLREAFDYITRRDDTVWIEPAAFSYAESMAKM